MKEVNKAAYTCEHSAHQVSEELCALDVDAEHICALAVSADSVETASAAFPISPPRESISHTICPLAEPPIQGLQGILAMQSSDSVNIAVFNPRRAAARAASHPA